MSPRSALDSPVALFYLALVFGLLVLAGVPLYLWRHRAKSAWEAYLGWLWMVPILAVVLFLGRETTIVFFTLVGMWAFREFARATELKEPFLIAGVFLGMGTIGVLALRARADLFATLPVFVLAGLLAVPVVRNRSDGQLRRVGLAIFGFLYFGWMFGHVALLANAKHAYAYLIYLLFAVQLNDVSAFVTGKAFGQRPLRDQISPSKTWGGSLGALAVSLALPWSLWWTFPHLRPLDLVAIGCIVGVGGQVGDLVSSVIKRDVGIKDMGSTIPGHGGVLDRIDSLLYVAPLYFHYLRFRQELLFSA